MSITPQQRAEKSAEAMFATDAASKSAGITIDEIAPGRAVLSMTVRDDMVNGMDVCHGGYIFTLADSCFAFACNSYNTRFFAHHCTVTYLVPGRKGSKLTATATETHKKGRSGIYDVTVTDETGETVAIFRGMSRAAEGRHFEE